MSELESCPNCKSKPDMVNISDKWFVMCGNCYGRGPVSVGCEQCAIDMWNNMAKDCVFRLKDYIPDSVFDERNNKS